MSLLSLPWVELSILLPLLTALSVRFCRDTAQAGRLTLGCTIAVLICTLLAWFTRILAPQTTEWSILQSLFGSTLFKVDRLSAPLLPLIALLHVLTVLTTARVKMNRMSFTGHLAGEALRLSVFACLDPWPLIILLALSTIPPFMEMVQRGKPIRVYVLHMALFIVLLAGGWAGVEAGWSWGPAILLAAILVRSGTVPAHLWVADLFENATFGTALLFVTPITGIYAALRLVVPIAPEPWILQIIGIASLLTAVYAAGLAVIQKEARRFFAYLFLSHASLILIGLELHTVTSLTGALCLWASVALSLGGLGLTLRALEARYGRLTLTGYSGLYEQSPALAVGFLLMGLGSVGFPGTLGFVATELLVDGAIEANLWMGICLVFTTALNGIAVVRAYLLLFTGTRHTSAIPMPITFGERIAVLTLCSLIVGGGLIPQLGVTDRFKATLSLPITRFTSHEHDH